MNPVLAIFVLATVIFIIVIFALMSWRPRE